MLRAAMAEPISLVLSGGGCKTFWGMGAYEVLEDLLPPIERWSAVSAGVAMALARCTGLFAETMQVFLDEVDRNESNIYPRRVFSRHDRAFPHDGIYRGTIAAILERGGFERVRESVPVHMLISHIEPGYPLVRTSAVAVRNHMIARRRRDLHGPGHLAPGLGYRALSSHDAQSPAELIDWIVASSTIPPFTRIQREGGRTFLDGGLVDNTPIRALPKHARAEGRKIVCLISHYKPTPRIPMRTPEGAEILYLAAPEPLPIRIWDYTSPDKVQEIFERGKRDAEALRPVLAAFTSASR